MKTIQRITRTFLLFFLFLGSLFFLNNSFSQGSGAIEFEEDTQNDFVGTFLGEVLHGDFSGNGFEDILMVGLDNNESSFIKLYENDGEGVFTENTTVSFELLENASMATADVNGDGMLDILMMGVNSDLTPVVNLYMNYGEQGFSMLNTSFEPVKNGSLSFFDADGDLDLDVLIAGVNANGMLITTLYLNDGNGNFTEDTDASFVGLQDAVVTVVDDMDGMGTKGVLLSGTDEDGDNITKLYEVDEQGVVLETSNSFVEASSTSAMFVDVDGDLDQDILIAGYTDQGPKVILYENNNGVFQQSTTQPFDDRGGVTMACADVDGDLDLDILIAGFNTNGEPVTTLYENDGDGSFQAVEDLPFEGVGDGFVSFMDVDGDLDLDILIAGIDVGGDAITKLYLNLKSEKGLGIKEGELPLVMVYPNPVEDVLSIQMDQSVNDLNVEVVNSLGKTMQSTVLNGVELNVDFTDLPAGVYFVHVANLKVIKVVKL